MRSALASVADYSPSMPADNAALAPRASHPLHPSLRCHRGPQVNSKFTAATYTRTFTSLTEEPGVLYPSLDFSAFDREVGGSAADLLPGVPVSAATVFLSINRFERKKNLKLALLAMSELKERLSGDAAAWANVHLVMAGGYDPRLPVGPRDTADPHAAPSCASHVVGREPAAAGLTFRPPCPGHVRRTLSTFRSCRISPTSTAWRTRSPSSGPSGR